MGQAAQKPVLNAEEFITWESGQVGRHEFVDGEVFAMSGAEDRHVTVTGNVYMALREHLRGTPCRTFVIDMKLHVAAANSYFYPDVMVTCDAGDAANPLIKTQPVLLVEVLSPSTAAYDRGEKFVHYRQIASLREYVLIDIDTRRTDVFRRQDDGRWVLNPFAAPEPVHLASVNITITAEALFAEVDPTPSPGED